ncbi:MAG: hypothetical protein M3119_02465 [Verrucomicrobiota bacterium]|nr:hypothetical protein [Verrucomicrobiota bacterium]
MMKRILLAGLLGAIAMFVWNFVAHMLLPLGELGVSQIPNQSAVLSALQNNLGEQPGLFFFPTPELKPGEKMHDKQVMERMVSQYESKPTGILVYRPAGRPFTFGKWLAREFGFQFVESLLVAYLLAQAALPSYLKRVVFVTIIGVVVAITTNMSYWNWYGFPKLYTVSYMFTQAMGYFCAGLVIAWILKTVQIRTA